MGNISLVRSEKCCDIIFSPLFTITLHKQTRQDLMNNSFAGIQSKPKMHFSPNNPRMYLAVLCQTLLVCSTKIPRIAQEQLSQQRIGTASVLSLLNKVLS